jgi:hypothetical protein
LAAINEQQQQPPQQQGQSLMDPKALLHQQERTYQDNLRSMTSGGIGGGGGGGMPLFSTISPPTQQFPHQGQGDQSVCQGIAAHPFFRNSINANGIIPDFVFFLFLHYVGK